MADSNRIPPLSPTPEPSPPGPTTSASPASPASYLQSHPLQPPVTPSFDNPQHRTPEAAHQDSLPAYSPSAISPSARHFLASEAGAIYKEHQLPPALDVMDEIDLMGLSFAYESRHMAELELQLVERRYRQVILKARVHQLRVFRTRERLQDVTKSLNTALEVALQQSAHLQSSGLRALPCLSQSWME